MKKNVGNTDRFVRVMFGIILLILFMSGAIENNLVQWIVLGVSMILIITAFATFCPLYALVGKNTCEVKRKK
ncbi:DUF2892 domain-containing protein [Flavobacterium azooxidireducens]|uniref:DUF2892 domain-containing protein n=1 Tax=Flavobacterium azooxidireducens TaxID=1871076 RepID=A0ABY4KDZ8_9FLAO|nr:DUF2892 domain-containing protein [Flavobacterium azooxidireducens]UPQ79026.1 DUF2892 domain-containing protein [Flavobacterium azooxidireducens]